MKRSHVISHLRSTLLSVAAFAAASSVYAVNLPDVPLFTASGAPPIVMLNVSRDHQLFYKAYNDFSDLDGNDSGAWETTYKHSIKYYGYFDYEKCYTYDNSNGRFSPHHATSDRKCNGQWSGNFLNWISMSRADIMRKVLYGGLRSTDQDGTTVLERAHLPTDAHSWAKYYYGDGSGNRPSLNELTPFSEPAATTATLTLAAETVTRKNYALPSGFAKIGDQLKIYLSNRTYYAVATCASFSDTNTWNADGSCDGGNTFTLDFGVSTALVAGTYTVANLSKQGVTFCNTTFDTTNQSQTTTNPPLIRAARGNYALWAANEKSQCSWLNEYRNAQSSFGGVRSNGNRYGTGAGILSGIPASAENPSSAARGLTLSGAGPNFTARVQVCVSGLLGGESCKLYPNGNYKPVGLLQKYGEASTNGGKPSIYFGLVTGSYKKNISGGVLRKNAEVALSNGTDATQDEINPNSGRFTGASGILKTLNALKIYGWNYSDRSYLNSDTCNYQQIGIIPSGGSNSQGSPATEGDCSSWGNPMSEMYVESLRYLAGLTEVSAFAYDHANSKDAAVGLSDPVTGSNRHDPITSQNYCSPLNILAINASVSSYDTDQIDAAFTFDTLATYTNAVGAGEGITSAYVGRSGTTYDGLCTLKSVGALASVNGICPEAPSLEGGYGIAGAAYYAHTHRIRTTPAIGDQDTTSYKVTTYGVALATNVPRIDVTVGGNPVVIQPAYRLDRSDVATGRFGTGTIVDFKEVEKTSTSGKYYINWEDSNQGGDYDQDVIGLLSYTINGNQISVTTQVIAASTGSPQGFGFVISGTSADGPHFYSGIYNFTYNLDRTGIAVTGSDVGTKIENGGCKSCNDQSDRTARTAAFAATGSTGTSLKDPLYYAAKWGGFKDSDGSATPNNQAEWDSKLVDGSASSAGDGQPDNFFYVTNPGALEQSLSAAFEAIVNASAASAVATNSSSLQSGSTIYQAVFNPKSWEGDLRAFSVGLDGTIGTRTWSAAEQLPAADSRKIVTVHGDTRLGIPFRWARLSATQQASILGSDTNTSVGQNRVDYIRGDGSNEGTGATQFRQRLTSKLGDIVDSNPLYVGVPSGQYSSQYLYLPAYLNASYYGWRAARTTRTPMVYVGANDGMMHAFNASTGQEQLAFVPSEVYSNLGGLSSPAYKSSHKFFVDGSPQAADVQYGTSWKSVLVSGMRQGGKGLFALDITDPSSFSETNASSLVLWEFKGSDDADGDMGYVFAQPLIAKLANNKWAAIVGNGYNSTNQKAALFILFIERSGTTWTSNYKKIVVDNVGSNGLAGVTGFDANADGMPETLYAGDLKGNMWRFDVSSSDPDLWSASLLGEACTTDAATCPAVGKQPITTPPEITRHPLNVDTPLVYFGTGKYLEIADISSTQVQSMYGIWDRGAQVPRSDLLVQTISNTSTGRTVTDEDIDWSTKKGWVEDLPASGERVTGAPFVISGVLFYNTLIPSSSPCKFGGSGYFMAVDYANGGLLSWAVFDTSGDNQFTNADVPSAGVETGLAPGGTRLLLPSGESTRGVAITNPTDLTQDSKPRPTPTDLRGAGGSRISWRELIPR
ncbi:PilC/PilY family type IV pilus protein [Niveibacterium sp. SC-1]|uniref:pilus assembly protein n=1 Tax=Niveibacterium sp. SC-1 TaxID=3135646 RepID=UPI00311F8190